MPKSQIGLIAGAAGMVLLLFFAFDTVPSAQKLVEKSRAMNFETADWTGILKSAEGRVAPDDLAYINTLRNVVENAAVDTQRMSTLKQLSGVWFEKREFAVAGYYAEKAANLEQTEESWSIAGATYAYALSSDAGSEIKDVCLSRAEICFENAISLDPEELDHRINLAICYAEYPPPANPMKGIQSLLALNREHPDDTSVMYHLARYGLQTGQTEKAIERLETALTIRPGERRVVCLLSQAYEQAGDMPLARKYRELCTKE